MSDSLSIESRGSQTVGPPEGAVGPLGGGGGAS
jgi:hypothetical protein